jgi:hypothetical protein
MTTIFGGCGQPQALAGVEKGKIGFGPPAPQAGQNFVFAAVRVKVWLSRGLRLVGMTFSKRLQVRKFCDELLKPSACQRTDWRCFSGLFTG